MAIYSERLMQHSAVGDWSWYVPAGHRAVCRMLTVVNTISRPGRILVLCDQTYTYYAVVPASSAPPPVELRLTLYAGERLNFQILDEPLSVVMNGFLFLDPTGKGQPAGAPVPAPEAALPPHELRQVRE